jgi:hypothetical protein
VVNPAFQVLLSVQVVLVLEWIVLLNSIDPQSSGGSSGGGCVHNPNAPARFDMDFILLMVLSAYYLIRRKRRFV